MSKQSLTEKMNDDNVSAVRKQILMKQGYNPYYGTINAAEAVITDMDHFPYTRFYRGVYNSSDPVVMEREAGWRPRRPACYQGKCCDTPLPYPKHCFETACGTTFPCYTNTLSRYADREALLVQINDQCINQYR
jgi:hypothetical protein